MHPGTYNEHDINVTKRLFIVSVSGAASTVIDAQASSRCFIFKTQWSGSSLWPGIHLTMTAKIKNTGGGFPGIFRISLLHPGPGRD